jgi:hypothetical protein
MKLTARIFGLALWVALPSYSYWYWIPTTDFMYLEQINSSTLITLGVRYDAPYPYYIQRKDAVSSIACNQINFTPPTGKEMQWFSLISTAVSTGQDISIMGDCDVPSGVVNVDGRNGGGRVVMGR